MTERTKAIHDDPNLEGSADAHLDSASIAKVKFFLHAYVRFDPIDLVSLTLAWSDKTAQHGPGKPIVSFYYVSMNGCSLTIELSDRFEGLCVQLLHCWEDEEYRKLMQNSNF